MINPKDMDVENELMEGIDESVIAELEDGREEDEKNDQATPST